MPAGEKRVQAQWVSTGDPNTVSDQGPLRYPGQVGGYFTDTANKLYRYVLLDSTMTVAPYAGAVAWWSNRTSGIVTTSSTNRGRRAGIFTRAHQLTGTDRALACFIQVGGRRDDVKLIDAVTAAPTTAGLFIVPSATDGKADCLASGTAATFPALGVSASTKNLGNSTCSVDLSVEDDFS